MSSATPGCPGPVEVTIIGSYDPGLAVRCTRCAWEEDVDDDQQVTMTWLISAESRHARSAAIYNG